MGAGVPPRARLTDSVEISGHAQSEKSPTARRNGYLPIRINNHKTTTLWPTTKPDERSDSHATLHIRDSARQCTPRHKFDA